MSTRYTDDYEVLCELGRGGMGVVYLARQKSLDRRVAVKVILSEAAHSTGLRRFAREAHILKDLVHPNVVRLLDCDLLACDPYLVFEYVEGGRTLGDLLHGRPLPLDRTLSLAIEIASGLAHIHQHSILHRDLKPANILIDRAGHARIIDMGLAKSDNPDATQLTQEGHVLGTVGYMAPEHLLGEPMGPRSDVYSLGLILYELLAGKFIFSGQASVQFGRLRRVAEGVPPIKNYRADLPRSLATLVERCVSLDSARRPRDGAALAAELTTIAQGGEPTALLGEADPIHDRSGPAWKPLGPGRSQAQATRDRPQPPPERTSRIRPRALVACAALALCGAALSGRWLAPHAATGPGAGGSPRQGAVSVMDGSITGPSPLAPSLDPTALAAELARRLRGSRQQLSLDWLGRFASSQVPRLRKNREAVSRALADHLESLGLVSLLERFWPARQRYFASDSIADAEKWELRSLLCDLELIESFCLEHTIRWPLRISIGPCWQGWDDRVEPWKLELARAKSYSRCSNLAVEKKNRYFPGETLVESWTVPPPPTTGRALFWFPTLRWRSGLVLDVWIGRRVRRLVHFAGVSLLPPVRVHVVDGCLSSIPRHGVEVVLPGSDEVPSERGYMGTWVPGFAFSPCTEIRIRMVDLPYSPVTGTRNPALVSRVLTIGPGL